MHFLDIAAPALVGIILQEVLQWYKLAGITPKGEFSALVKNKFYWLFFFAVCISGTLFIYYYISEENYRQKDIVLIGAALPTLLRQFIAGVNARQPVTLGENFTDTYFR